MSYRTPEYRRINDEGDRIHDELKAILAEHLPPDVQAVVWKNIDAMSSNHYAIADYNDRRIYRALMGLIPEHAQEVRAAFQPIVFDGSRCDESDWLKWERGIEWPITPAYHDLLMNGHDA